MPVLHIYLKPKASAVLPLYWRTIIQRYDENSYCVLVSHIPITVNIAC
jgi:hypothetical protein